MAYNVAKRYEVAQQRRFTKVKDGRGQPIRGLWKRNDRYYAQLSVEDAQTAQKKIRRVPLTDRDGVPVQSDAEARTALDRLKTQRADDVLPMLKRTPKFSEWSKSISPTFAPAKTRRRNGNRLSAKRHPRSPCGANPLGAGA